MAINNILNGESAANVRDKLNQVIQGVNIHNSAGYATVQYITNLIANYYLKSETYNKTEINSLIANIQGLQFKIIANISEVVDSRHIYLLPISEETGNNKYSEYLCINSKAELIGELNTSIDLSNYITSGQLATALSAYVTSSAFNTAISNLANTYVAKEEGKSLIEDAKIAKLDSLPSSVYSQAETQQAINTAIEGVNSAGTRVSFVKEYKNGTLEYIGENGVILQDIYSKMIELKELPELENEENIYDITNEPIGNNLYLVIDNITISGGIDVFSSINNDHYKFDIIQETATSIPKLKCTCLIANTKNFTAKIKLSYIKYFGEKVSFSIECASEAEANSLELSIPKLKFNKEALLSFTMDDHNASDYSVVHAAINNRPMGGHLNALNQKGYYHANQWEVEDLPSVVYPAIGYSLCSTDGCGNDRKFRTESSIWVWRDGFTDLANIDKGNIANDWRFSIVLKQDDLIEMLKFGCSVSPHDINVNIYNENDAISITEGWENDKLLFKKLLNRGFKMVSQPNGNVLYLIPFVNDPEYLGTFDRAHGHVLPMSDNLELYKAYFYRTFPENPSFYITDVDAEMAKLPEERIYMHCGVHTADQNTVTFLKYIHDNYGKGGSDKIWFATREEFYEYWYMRKYTKIIKNVVGTTANFDIYIPKGQYFYFPELTFISNQNINIPVNLDDKIKGFSFNSANMFNVNIDANLIAVTEEFVSKYESNTYVVGVITYDKSSAKKASEKADALYFANQLRPDLKTPFLLRIDAVENVPLESLSISGGNVTDLLIGETTQLTAVFTPAGTAQTNIEWSVNDEAIATVDSNGLVTCVGAGELRVTVQSLDNPAIHAEKEILCVASRPITGIAISGESNGIIDDEIQLTVTLTPINTTEAGILWESDNNTIAEVTQSGLVTLKSVGTVKITATSLSNELVYDELIITVAAEAIPIESITVNGITPIEVGNTEQFSVTYNPTDTTEVGVVWTSSNQNVATVNSNGLVTATGEGTAVITATSIHRQVVAGTKEITITPQVIAITGLTITGETAVDNGNTLQLGIAYTPINTTQQGVTWSSSDETKATVNSSGLVTANAEGVVVITATSAINGAISDTHNITINAVSNLYAVIKAYGNTVPSGGYGIKEYNGWKYSATKSTSVESSDNTFYWSDNSVAGKVMEATIDEITSIIGTGYSKNYYGSGITDTLPADKWYPSEFYTLGLCRSANPNPTPPYGAYGLKLYNLSSGTYKVKIWDVNNRIISDGMLYNVNGNSVTPFTGHRFTSSSPDVHGTSSSKPQLKEVTVTIGAGENIVIISHNTTPTVAFNQGAAISAIEIEKIG
ncbi:MAG: Ig-like domain-containing protein [Bacteroidales bacterium]